MALTGANSLDATQFGDSEAGSEGAGLFAQASGDGFKLGVSRNVGNMGNVKSTVTWADQKLALNTTYLAVVKYQIVEGADNDIISLWINPAKSDTEPAAAAVANETATESLADVRGIEIRQGSAAVAKTPEGTIDEVRVASTWAEIFAPAKADDTNKPVITLSSLTADFGKVYQGLTYTQTVNVKAKNLTGDITISAPTSGELTVAPATIAKADAERKNIEKAFALKTANDIYGWQSLDNDDKADFLANCRSVRKEWLNAIAKDAEREYQLGDVDRDTLDKFISKLA